MSISKNELKVGHLVLIDVENAVNLERKEYYAVITHKYPDLDIVNYVVVSEKTLHKNQKLDVCVNKYDYFDKKKVTGYYDFRFLISMDICRIKKVVGRLKAEFSDQLEMRYLEYLGSKIKNFDEVAQVIEYFYDNQKFSLSNKIRKRYINTAKVACVLSDITIPKEIKPKYFIHKEGNLSLVDFGFRACNTEIMKRRYAVTMSYDNKTGLMNCLPISTKEDNIDWHMFVDDNIIYNKYCQTVLHGNAYPEQSKMFYRSRTIKVVGRVKHDKIMRLLCDQHHVNYMYYKENKESNSITTFQKKKMVEKRISAILDGVRVEMSDMDKYIEWKKNILQNLRYAFKEDTQFIVNNYIN